MSCLPRYSLRNLCSEFKAQVIIILPVCITFFMRRSLSFISLMFVAHIGTLELSAIGLASVTANVTGFSMVIGLSGAVSTLCSQSFGAGDLLTMNIVVQRAVVIIVVLVNVPVSLMWWFSRDIMTYLGQDIHIATYANAFMVYLIPGLFANSCSICIQNWLHAQSRASAIAFVGVTVALLHPLWCYLLIYKVGLGFRGAAVATSCSQFLELAFVLSYVFFSDVKDKMQFAFSSACFRDWWPFLKLGFPSLLMMMEWWAAETVIFLSGILPNPESTVAAMAVYQSTLSMAYMFPLSVGVAGCTRVGNAVGANFSFGGRLAAFFSCTFAFLVCLFISLLLLTHRLEWCKVYSSDPAVIAVVMKVIPVACAYVIFDGMQCVTSNILKGVGKQAFAGPIVMVYPFVAVPISVLLGFKYKMGVLGLALGTMVGVGLHFMMMVVVIMNLDWDKVTAEYQEKKRKSTSSSEDIQSSEKIEAGRNESTDDTKRPSYFQQRQREQQQQLLWEESQNDTTPEWFETISGFWNRAIMDDDDNEANVDCESSHHDDSIGTGVVQRRVDMSSKHLPDGFFSMFRKQTRIFIRAIARTINSAEKREYELVRSATDSLSLDALEDSDCE